MDEMGKWSLAPAYDLCYSYSPSGQWTNRHQLSLNGKRNDFTFSDLMEVAAKIDIKNGKEIIFEIIDVVSQWETYATETDVNKVFALQIAKNLRLLK
jgi:serine/threonine-protein kinase HipA